MAIGAYNLDAYLDMEDETRWWPWPEDEDLPDMDGRDGEDVGACEAVHDRVKRERCVTGHCLMLKKREAMVDIDRDDGVKNMFFVAC